MLMKAIVEARDEEGGFVYVDDKRMIFCHAKGNRRGYPEDENTLLLAESNWGKPTPIQEWACRRALEEAFPTHRVVS
jgi:hypothetical protein